MATLVAASIRRISGAQGLRTAVAPDSTQLPTIGTQPDMLEYVTSRAAAWDCPVSLVGRLDVLQAHPRTADNLEVLRRWEEVRVHGWLTQQQKLATQISTIAILG